MWSPTSHLSSIQLVFCFICNPCFYYQSTVMHRKIYDLIRLHVRPRVVCVRCEGTEKAILCEIGIIKLFYALQHHRFLCSLEFNAFLPGWFIPSYQQLCVKSADALLNIDGGGVCFRAYSKATFSPLPGAPRKRDLFGIMLKSVYRLPTTFSSFSHRITWFCSFCNQSFSSIRIPWRIFFCFPTSSTF